MAAVVSRMVIKAPSYRSTSSFRFFASPRCSIGERLAQRSFPRAQVSQSDGLKPAEIHSPLGSSPGSAASATMASRCLSWSGWSMFWSRMRSNTTYSAPMQVVEIPLLGQGGVARSAGVVRPWRFHNSDRIAIDQLHMALRINRPVPAAAVPQADEAHLVHTPGERGVEEPKVVALERIHAFA